MNKISSGYSILYPDDKLSIANRTMYTVLLLWILTLFSIIFLFLTNPSIYTAAIVSLLIAILHYEIVNGSLRHMEAKLLMQMEKFLSNIRHSYYINNMVEESIADAFEHCGNIIKIHAIKIYDILSNDDPYDDKFKSNSSIPNKYLKLFLALCSTVIQFGDQEVDGQSLFLMNIKTLKNDIHIELLKRKDMEFRFSGLIIITAAPVFFLKTIHSWSVSNLPELDSFYRGNRGIILAILIYIFTIIIYIMINQLKEVQSFIPEDHYILNRLININWIQLVLDNYIEKHYGRFLKTKELLKKADVNISGKQFLLKRILYGFITFIIAILVFLLIHITTKSGNLQWYEILLSWFIAYFAYWFPYLMLLYRRKVMQMNMEDEIIQYQSVIMMLMYMDRISVLNILEFMESFAVLFKDTIQNCINDYYAGDIKALEDMREREAFEPFKRLVDNLIISDKIGIEKAFDEINVDHIYYQDKRKQENEMILTNKVALGKLLAYIPLILTLGFYLIVPFVIESFKQLKEYSDVWSVI